MSDAKNIAETVDMPAGLDVVPSVPGTFVGGHDIQGTDGKTRTDRPGEILGTVALTDTQEKKIKTNAARESERADFVTSEVDRANREDLPKLGGDADDDGWEADSARKSSNTDRQPGSPPSPAATPATRTYSAAPDKGKDK